MSDHLLTRALRGETVERVPVWAMRQAGRWDPEFLRIRGDTDFYTFANDTVRATKASLLPERFGVDGIILFYDITTLLVAMGQPFDLLPRVGPMPRWQVASMKDVQRLNPEPKPENYDGVIRLLESTLACLQGRLPVLVFAGASFTVASYALGAGKNIDMVREFAHAQPETWAELLQRITKATQLFVQELARRGAAAFQLFDSWAGGLSPTEYNLWAHPHHQAVFDSVDIPRILFVKENPHLDRMTQSGATVISLGGCHDLADCRRRWPNLVFQGNVPQELMRNGTPEQVYAATKACLLAGGGHNHVLNLSHGMDPTSPVANFEAFIRAARE